MTKLSKQRQQLLYFIWNYSKQNRCPPAYEEMGEMIGVKSRSNVFYHLDFLEKEELITRIPRQARSTCLTEKGEARLVTLGLVNPPIPRTKLVELPIYGYIGASEPLWSATQTDMPGEILTLTSDLAPDRAKQFGLRVLGDSMRESHIDDGDIVVMCPLERPPHNGEMVAVWLHSRDETTLKHFYKGEDEDTVRLVPANPDYDVIEVPAEDVEVQGRVVAVIRQY